MCVHNNNQASECNVPMNTRQWQSYMTSTKEHMWIFMTPELTSHIRMTPPATETMLVDFIHLLTTLIIWPRATVLEPPELTGDMRCL